MQIIEQKTCHESDSDVDPSRGRKQFGFQRPKTAVYLYSAAIVKVKGSITVADQGGSFSPLYRSVSWACPNSRSTPLVGPLQGRNAEEGVFKNKRDGAGSGQNFDGIGVISDMVMEQGVSGVSRCRIQEAQGP